jgi:hypothetical protein
LVCAAEQFAVHRHRADFGDGGEGFRCAFARTYQETAATIIGARLLWATLQWMGRLYILTDLRILCVWGVFNIELFDCPLRKVARTRMVRGITEQIVAVGSIEIIPQDESLPFGIWQTVGRPQQVHEQILATISRAKQGGSCV